MRGRDVYDLRRIHGVAENDVGVNRYFLAGPTDVDRER